MPKKHEEDTFCITKFSCTFCKLKFASAVDLTF